ncbi:MAG TPA: histidine phosphatase family protein [Terricaulis sp.]|nr:histidine phosphatase family protein [Terricaulis sp.]HRP10371.1 histidine phosphatase family protein [Terricaulis sp.]
MTTTMAPNETLDRRAGARTGAIVIARHGRPNCDRTVKIDQHGYRLWWADYDKANLHPDERPPEALLRQAETSDVIFASTLPRAIRTAEAVAGGRAIITDPVFLEAPLPPPPVWGKRSPRSWGVLARAAWWVGRDEGGETRAQAELRAEAAVATLTAQALRGQNVLLCAHGWFNRMMRPILRAQGWREVEDGGDSYWSYRRYEKVK